jgi:hypothetical protein
MNDARSPEDWGDAYADLEPMYGRFGERLEELVRSLLQDEEISYIHTKTESESICTLVEREFEVDAQESLSFAGAEASNANLAAGGRPGRVFYDHPRIVVSLTDERKALPE